MRTLKDIAKKFHSEHLLKDDTYELGLAKKEAIKYYKKIIECQKDINKSIKLNNKNIVCHPTRKTRDDECYLVKEFIKHFFNIKEEEIKMITLCPHCHCMTKTIKGLCGKCGKNKKTSDQNYKQIMKMEKEINKTIKKLNKEE